ncbi:minor capsid protein [Salipaludibacillus agaradhaerens]|uniref:Minor capsid protein n=2 Tax=Salipaludibacillus agaradhaerens TaxID=76935 RepID=A0A9Q4B1Z8_SALAG|nr:minor capsid protein [Salipaludibacillus agaradhaerens]
MTLQRKFKEMDRALDRLERSYEHRLAVNYNNSLKEVRAKLSRLWEQTDGKFSESLKYNRLANLEKEISREIGKLTGKNANTLKAGLAYQFAESYYRTGFVIEGEAQAKLGFGQLNPKVIERAVENPLDRVGFLKRNRDNQALLTRQLNERITQGLIQGKSYQQVARDVKERFDVGAYKAMRIVQTESHRCQQQGRLDSLKQAESAGVKLKKVWVSSLDGSTRDTHQDLDGQRVGVNEEFESNGLTTEYPGGFGDPAEDINCRCSTRGEIEGYELKVRRVRGEGIIEQTSYNEWKKQRINN